MGSFTRSVFKRGTSGNGGLDAKIGEFTRLMGNAKDLSKIADYFHEQLETDEFMHASCAGENSKLMLLVRLMLRTQSGDAEITQMSLFSMPGRGFWHGAGLPKKGGIATVYYLEAINRGLFCFSNPSRGSKTDLLRFSVPQELTDDVELDSFKLKSYTLRSGKNGRAQA